MNIEHRTTLSKAMAWQATNIERRTKSKDKNKGRIRPKGLSAVLVVVMVILFSLPGVAWCETDDSDRNLRALSPDESRVILAKLSHMREDIHTLQADFIEERMIPSLPMPLKYAGKIYYRNDGFFFMEYLRPIHHILRVQKNEALFFVEGSKTADRVDISAANGIAGNPDIFAINPAKFSGQVLEDNASYILKDKKQDAGEKGSGPTLTVSLAKKSLLVNRVRIDDGSGDVTNISFRNVRTNQDIPKSIVSFELPEGVKINRIHQP